MARSRADQATAGLDGVESWRVADHASHSIKSASVQREDLEVGRGDLPRRMDAVVVGGARAEAAVVLRVAEDDDDTVAAFGAAVEPFAHEAGARVERFVAGDDGE